jgi:hypothetical protein
MRGLGRVVLGAVAAACLLALTATGAAAAPAQGAPGGSVNDGRLKLDFKIERFVVRNGKLAARGTAVARVSGTAAGTRTVRKRLTAPVRVAGVGRRRCDLITLSLAPLRLDLLGLRVETSEINLRIRGVRRGPGSGLLGRLLCSLGDTAVNRRVAATRAAARRLNTAMPARGLRTASVTADLHRVVAASHRGSCQVLFLQLGPLELNVLGLLVELFGETPSDPVTVTITAFPGHGILGDLLCGLAGGPSPPV